MGILNLFAASTAASGTTTINIGGTDYNLSSAPATITSQGRYTVSCTGSITFKLQVWGAGGGNGGSYGVGGAGGYGQGIITLAAGTNYLLIVGQNGSSSSGSASFPDGGSVPYRNSYGDPSGAPGGGSSRFGPFYSSGNENISTNTYYLIAGGGGGAHPYGSYYSYYGAMGGAGGGSTGQSAKLSAYGAGNGGGGTQSAGGTGGAASSYGGTGGTGIKYLGGDGVPSSSVYGGGGAGGGGYYGGGAGGTVYAAGGGGSGFVDGAFVTSGLLATGDYATPPDPLSNRPGSAATPNYPGAAIFTLV
jgi:hypothetical protein